jgi:hypothetical protein
VCMLLPHYTETTSKTREWKWTCYNICWYWCNEILNLTYNLLPHPSFLLERMGGVFFGKFAIAIPSLIVVLNLLPHLPSPCEKVGGAFSFGLSL